MPRMQSDKPEQTALGVARTRFLEALADKGREIEDLLDQLAAGEGEDVHAELRRRLNALLASAQVFRLPQLAEALTAAIEKLDAIGPDALDEPALDELRALSRSLPTLRERQERFSTVPSVEAIPAPTRRKSSPTLLGLPRTPPPEPPRPTPHPTVAPSSAPPPRMSPAPAPREVEKESRATVLVMAGPESKARIRAALPAGRYVVDELPVRALSNLVETVRKTSPDLVFVDAPIALDDDAALVRRLREDVLTGFIPVVLLAAATERIDPLLAREAGADEVLVEPVAPGRLLATVERLIEAPSYDRSFVLPEKLTAEELADRLAHELRVGLADAVERGGDVRIPLGDGADLMAIAWSTIARVRAHVAERTGGRVRFRDPPRQGLPSLIGLPGEDESSVLSATDVPLIGRRILVADDDPAVLWFFSSLLREEGALVREVADGAEALEAARAERPDLVLSDILMPGLDGFALCRELQRDPMLADVPTILLSWKEDFLQRMRELEAGASGYLKKEAESGAILARIREVLRPRARLEAQLSAGGDVKGRVEDIGIQTLLRATADRRPQASIAIRDAWNHFEAEIRDGALVALTRTAADGTFDRGSDCVPMLLGMTGGRFVVTDADHAVRATLTGTLDDVLAEGARSLGAVLRAVSGPGLAQAAEVRFLPEVVEGMVRQSPEEVRSILERLSRGEGPRDLMLAGEVAPQMLEAVLRDLGRRGAIAEVLGLDGEDRIALESSASRASAPPAPVEVGASPSTIAAVEEPTKPSLPVEASSERRSSLPAVLEELVDVIPDHASLRPKAGDTLAAKVEAEVSSPAREAVPPSDPDAKTISSDSTAPVATPVNERPARLAWAVVATVAIVGGAVFGASRATMKKGDESEAAAPVRQAPRTDQANDAPEVEPAPRDVDELSFGRIVPGITEADVSVRPGEGLLVVESSDDPSATVTVRLGDRVIGPPPARVALSEGRHELAFQRGAETTFRYVYVRAGATRIVPIP